MKETLIVSSLIIGIYIGALEGVAEVLGRMDASRASVDFNNIHRAVSELMYDRYGDDSLPNLSPAQIAALFTTLHSAAYDELPDRLECASAPCDGNPFGMRFFTEGVPDPLTNITTGIWLVGEAEASDLSERFATMLAKRYGNSMHSNRAGGMVNMRLCMSVSEVCPISASQSRAPFYGQ